MADDPRINLPSGHVVVTTYGVITQQTVGCLLEARSLSERQGATNIAWRMEPATLVERARLKFYPRLTSRRFQVHPNERHEPRKVRAVLPDEAEEEIPYFQRFRPESPGPIPAKVP